MHEQGGFHRDIKPDNLLVDEAGQFAIGDFGLGNKPTLYDDVHRSCRWYVGYVAPELTLPGAQATQAADIYSLGATLFHLLTGVHPRIDHCFDPGRFGVMCQRNFEISFYKWFNSTPMPTDCETSIRATATTDRDS